MDPSYNNPFAGNNSNPGFSPAPVVPGGGDIVLQPEKKSKKGPVIAIATLVLAAVIGVVGFLLVTKPFGGDNNWNDYDAEANAQMYDLLNEHSKDFASLISFMDSVTNGERSLADFILDDKEYVERKKELNGAAVDLEAIKQRVDNGKRLTGEINQINLQENFDKLKARIDEDYEKYVSFVNATLRIYEVFEKDGQIKAKNILDEYQGMNELASIIDVYLEQPNENTWQKINDAEILKNAYLTLLENFSYSRYIGDDSVIHYLNNLYVGVANEDAE